MTLNHYKLLIPVLIVVVIAALCGGIYVFRDKPVDYYGYMVNPRDSKVFLVKFQLIKGQLGEALTCITDQTLKYMDENLYREIVGKMTANNLSTADVNKLHKLFASYQGITMKFTVRNVLPDIFAFVTDYIQVEDSMHLRFKYTGKMHEKDITGKLFLEFVFKGDTPSAEVKFGYR